MIFHGALRALCERWLDEDLAGIHNDLVSGEAGIISLEPVRRMQKMAAIAANDPKLAGALRNDSNGYLAGIINSNKAFREELDAYLELFGDRCLDELKLESETLSDNPETLYRSIGQLARVAGEKRQSASNEDLRAIAEARVEESLADSPLRRFVFGMTLKLARVRVRDRENLRFERTRVYGRVRAIFLETGSKLVELGVLKQRDDIFYLSVEEIGGIVRGTGCTTRVADLVACRRREFTAYANDDGPPRRFITKGPAQLPSSIKPARCGSQPSTAARAGSLSGTMRSRPPLPRTTSNVRSRDSAPSGSPTSSDTRSPVA